jgi:hypothetical protein
VIELLPQGHTPKKTPPKSMTNAGRRRSVSFFIGTALLIAGAISLGVGVFAWRIPAPLPVEVTPAASAALPRTSIFDSGITLFAAVPDHRNPPAPLAFGCAVSVAGVPSTRVRTKPIPELVGSRVVGSMALTGVIDLGHPARGATVLCDGPAALASPSIWALPSNDGPSGEPLAIIVAAMFLLGLGALVHPRSRSI